MANKNKEIEQKQEDKQSAAPVEQVELTDEQLEQVVGGGIKVPQSPTLTRDTIILEE